MGPRRGTLGAVSSPRDRLGLLLPLPALLFTGQAQARAPEPSPPNGDPSAFEPPPDPGPGEVGDTTEPALSAAERRDRAKALYMRGVEAFQLGDFYVAGVAFEQSAVVSLGMLELHRQAAIAFRYATLAELDPVLAGELCEATRRNAEAVITHPDATPEQIEEARTEQAQADAHCNELQAAVADEPCLSSVRCLQPDLGPCLSIIEPSRGCGHHRDGSMAMLGAMALLGLRSRRRRDAVERLADRLPPDVVAKLRRNDRNGDDEPGEGDR
jgi:hypothetical protein